MEIVKPGNCVVIFPFPRTQNAFIDSVTNKCNSFAGECAFDGWEYYNEKILSVFNKLFDFMTAFGVRIYTESSLDNSGGCMYKPGGISWPGFRHKPGLKGILTDRTVGAVILFSHFDDKQGMEFYDAFKTKEEILNAIPFGYDGVIDLFVCNPNDPNEQQGKQMFEFLLEQRPNCNVLYRDGKPNPDAWIEFYCKLFRIMNTSHLSYEEAAAEAAVINLK